MNEQLQSAVAQILERAISGIDSSIEFMQAELPDVIEQLLLWYGVKGLVECLAGIVLILLMVKMDFYIFKKIKASNEFDFFDILATYGLIGSIFRAVYLFPLGFVNIEWLQIWIAPKIWLMEYAAKLVS